MKPQRRIYMDTIGPQEILINKIIKGKSKRNKKIQTKIITIYTLTIIDKLTSWPKIIGISDKISYEVSRIFNKEWLCRYP